MVFNWALLNDVLVKEHLMLLNLLLCLILVSIVVFLVETYFAQTPLLISNGNSFRKETNLHKNIFQFLGYNCFLHEISFKKEFNSGCVRQVMTAQS